jgi:transposase
MAKPSLKAPPIPDHRTYLNALATASPRELVRYFAIRLMSSDEEGTAMTRRAIAQEYEISERQLRRWTHRYIDKGLAGLKTRRPLVRGRPRKMTDALFDRQVAPRIEAMRAKSVRRLSGVQIHRMVREELKLEMGYSTLLKHLRRHGVRLRDRGLWSCPSPR